MNWHEKLRRCTSTCSSDQRQTPDLNASKPGVPCTKACSTTREHTPSKGCRYQQEEVEVGRLSVASSEPSPSGSWHSEPKGCNHRAAACAVNMWSQCSSDCSKNECLQQSQECSWKSPELRSQVPALQYSIGIFLLVRCK